VRQVGYLQRLYRDARLTEHTNNAISSVGTACYSEKTLKFCFLN